MGYKNGNIGQKWVKQVCETEFKKRLNKKR